jgi:hypothetical protein
MNNIHGKEEPTAWEDINPPMASAKRQELQSRSSERLKPATRDDFRNELTACLTLVAPVGMNEEAKRDWLAVAWQTLKHLPADMLSRGCKAARETCDHPAKIVPAIMRETEEAMRRRREAAREQGEPVARIETQYVTPDEAAQILREVGLKPAGEMP